MSSNTMRRRGWWSWLGVGLLFVLCALLAGLQYRWIGEVADAEKARLQDDLETRLNLLRRNFDDQVNTALAQFIPHASEIEQLGREDAYLQSYLRGQGSLVVR